MNNSGNNLYKSVEVAAPGGNIHQSQQRQQGVRDVIDRFQGQWRQYIGAAENEWNLLSEYELMQTYGRFEKLTWLIEGRYAVSPRDANNQVKNFMEQCGV